MSKINNAFESIFFSLLKHAHCKIICLEKKLENYDENLKYTYFEKQYANSMIAFKLILVAWVVIPCAMQGASSL